jgi:hypothetical protein
LSTTRSSFRTGNTSNETPDGQYPAILGRCRLRRDKIDQIDLTKQQLLAHILRQYERRGDAMRCLDKQGKIGWKASPRFLTMLADAERDVQDEL